MRGFGFSTYNNPLKSYKDLANDVNIFMNEIFPEIEEFYIFGHNIGGNVALELAKAYPDKVKGLIMLALQAQKDNNNKIYEVIEKSDKDLYKGVLKDYYQQFAIDDKAIENTLKIMKLRGIQKIFK